MGQDFSDTFTGLRRADRRIGCAAEDMDDSVRRSARLIAECREAIAKADEVLNRDWRIWGREATACLWMGRGPPIEPHTWPRSLQAIRHRS
jgi:hypothetical protein